MSVGNPNNGISNYWEVENNPWIRRCGGNDSSPNHQNKLVNTHDHELQVLLCRNCQQTLYVPTSNPPPPKPSETRKSLSLQIKDHFVRFCECTSLRGVPRIVKTKETKRRFLWVFFVLIFFVGCITCVVFIVNQYLRSDVIHQPVTQAHKPRPFPSLTVCNTRPISERGYTLLQKQNLMTPMSYQSAMIKAYRHLLRSYNVSKEKQRYLSMSYGLPSYLQDLSKHVNIQKLGHDLDDMIIECNLVVVSGNFNLNRYCHHIGTWTPIVSGEFLNCYSFTVTSDESLGMKNINLMIYLGQRHPECGDCYASPEAQVDGVRLQLHETATYPNVNEGGVYLSPGTLTEIQFLTKEWQMMEPPHGICKRNQHENIQMNNNTFRFTGPACALIEVQKKIAEKCNCINFEKPILPQYKQFRVDRQFCRKPLLSPFQNESKEVNLTLDYIDNEYLKYMKCSVRIEKEFINTNLGCFSPCTYYTYDTSTSSTKWPTKAFQSRFFDRLHYVKSLRMYGLCKKVLKITERRSPRKVMSLCEKWLKETTVQDKTVELLREKQKFFDEMLAKNVPIDNNRSTLESVLQRMKVREFIANHFLTIQVSRANFDIIVIEEKAVISLTSLFSQVGGLLSIWVGLTFVCIVEIIELFLNVVETISNNHRS